MRFLLTMNMPSSSNNLVHQINAGYPVESLEEFMKILTERDFIIVEEFYKDRMEHGYYSRGKQILNTHYIGKVKVLIGD